jgi:hypothetical protein
VYAKEPTALADSAARASVCTRTASRSIPSRRSINARVERSRGTPGARRARSTIRGADASNHGDTPVRASFSTPGSPRPGRAIIAADAPTAQRASRAACRSSSSSEWIDTPEKSKSRASGPPDAAALRVSPDACESSPSRADRGPALRGGCNHAAVAAVRPVSGLDSCACSIAPTRAEHTGDSSIPPETAPP